MAAEDLELCLDTKATVAEGIWNREELNLFCLGRSSGSLQLRLVQWERRSRTTGSDGFRLGYWFASHLHRKTVGQRWWSSFRRSQMKPDVF